jgi:propanediol utilization protein
LGVADGQRIQVKVDGERETTFGDVVVRVNPQYALDMHLDTDEANAAGLTNDSVATFAGVQGSA